MFTQGKHTQGPLAALRHHVSGAIERGEGRPVVGITKELVAAAPELLAALEDAEFLLRKAGMLAGPMQDSFRRSAEDARNAIAKARGEQH